MGDAPDIKYNRAMRGVSRYTPIVDDTVESGQGKKRWVLFVPFDPRVFQLRKVFALLPKPSSAISLLLIISGGVTAWADGIRETDCRILDAKYVGNPDRSPYVPDSNLPTDIRKKVDNQERDLFRRYSAILRDPFVPLSGLEIITNEVRSVPYWQGLIKDYNIPNGQIIIRP